MNTLFYEEVKGQAAAFSSSLRQMGEDGCAAIRTAARMIRDCRALVLSGMGTSMNVTSCVLEALSDVTRVNAIQSYQLLQTNLAGIRPGDLVFLISQSGESGEIVELCRRLKGRCPLLAMTNDTESFLAKSADCVLPLFSPKENSITNSTFTASLAVLKLLAAAVRGEDLEALSARMQGSCAEAERILREEGRVFALADSIAKYDRIHFIGRSGDEMALADQASLIFKEGAFCNAQSFNAGAFRHGPIEVCGGEHLAVLFVTDETSRETMEKLGGILSRNGSRVLYLTSRPLTGEQFQIAAESPEEFMLPAAVLLEMLVARIAENKGREAGVFHIGGKICREM